MTGALEGVRYCCIHRENDTVAQQFRQLFTTLWEGSEKRSIDKVFVAKVKPNSLLTPQPKPTRARELSQRVPNGSASKLRSPRASPSSLAQYDISTPACRTPKRGRSGSMGRDDSACQHIREEAHRTRENYASSTARQRSREKNDPEDAKASAGSSRGASNAPSSRKSSNLGKRSSSRISRAHSMNDHISNQTEMESQGQMDLDRNNSSSVDTARAASN